MKERQIVVILSLSRVQLSPAHGLQPIKFLCPSDFPGKNTGVGCLTLLQGIFPTQGSNPSVLHCRQTLLAEPHEKPKTVDRQTEIDRSVQFSHSVVSDSLRPHGLQHARLPCPSPTPRVCSDSCSSSRSVMPSNHLILCHPPLLLPAIPSSIRVFPNESILWRSAFFTVQLSHPYMTPGKTIALTRRTFFWQSNVSAFEYAICCCC